MRHQDELVRALAATAAVEPRRYVLRQMGDLPLSADFDDVVAALHAEERCGGQLAPLATTVLTRQWPRWLALRHGARTESAPSDAWLSAGSHLLEPCLGPLAAAASSPDARVRAGALRCLARFHHHGARALLEQRAREHADAAIALASTGDPEALPALIERLHAPAGPRAELVRHLELYPAPETVREVRAALRAPEPDVRIAAAIALEGFGELDPLALARPLLSTWDERWPLVHLADSLGRTAVREAAGDLAKLHETSKDPLVRIAAIRSVVNLGGEEAARFARKVLDAGSDAEKAAVLDGFTQVGLSAGDLRARLEELADAEHGRLALNAAIVLAAVDPGASTRRAVAWLRADDADVRQQGAYLLGYLPSDVARKVASKIAVADPSPAVRLELFRALAKYPPAEAGAALAACLRQEDPLVGARAVRYRAQAGDLGPDELAGQLGALLAREADPLVRAEVVTQLGIAAPADDAAHDALAAQLRGADAEVATAAALAISATGHEPLAARLAGLPGSAGAGVRGAVAVARFALADSGWVGALQALLTGGRDEQAAGVAALEQILLLLPRLPASPRHDGLRRHLTDHLRAPEYEAFARQRLALPARPAAVRGYADLAGAPAAPRAVSVSESTANLLIALDPNPSRAVKASSMLSGRYPRPQVPSRPDRVEKPDEPGTGWSAAQTVIALAIVTCATAFLVVREAKKPKAPPVTGPSAAAPSVVPGLLVISVDGAAQAAERGKAPAPLAAGRALETPVTVTTERSARAALAPRVRQNRVTLLESSRVTFASLEAGAKPSGYALALTEPAGALLVGFSFGEPHLRIELPDAAVEAGRVVLRLDASEASTTLKVSWNEATVRAGKRTVRVKEGQALSWPRGGEPGEPAAVDMSREVWK